MSEVTVVLGDCSDWDIKFICSEFFKSLPDTLPIKKNHDFQSISELIRLLMMRGELTGAIAFSGGLAVGMFLVELGEDEWSRQALAIERALYVNPNYRGRGFPKQMIEKTIAHIEKYFGDHSLEVGTTLKGDAPHVSKLYRDLGFTEVTGSFTKELQRV